MTPQLFPPDHRRYRWLPALIPAVCLSIVLLGASALMLLEQHLIDTAGRNLALLAGELADKLDQMLFERAADLRVAAGTVPVLTHSAQLTALLTRMKEEYLLYRWLGITNATGVIVAATTPAQVGQSRNGTPWFDAVRTRKTLHVEAVTSSEETGSEMRAVALTVPILDQNGAFLGALRALVGMTDLEDTIARGVTGSTSLLDITHSLEWQLIDAGGRLLMDSMLREEDQINLRQLGVPSAQRVAQAVAPGWIEERHPRRGLRVLTGYARVEGLGEFPSLGWGLLVRAERETFLQPVSRTLWIVGLVLIGLVAPLVGLLAWLTSQLRRQWVDAQAHREQLYTTLLSIGDAVIVTDAQGRVQLLNPVAEQLTGWSHAEAQGRSLTDIFDILNEHTRQPVESPVTRVLREGVIVGLANHTLLRSRHGTERPIEDSGAPIRDVGGQVSGVVLVFRDISERRAAEAKLREAYAELSTLVETMEEAIITMDHDQRIWGFNAGAERLFGVHRAAILGNTLDDLFPPRLAAGYREEISRFIRSAERTCQVGPRGVLVGRRADGQEIPLAASLVKLEVGGRLRITMMLRDLTEQQQLETWRRAQYEVTKLLSQAPSLPELYPRLLEILVRGFHWTVGAVWLVDQPAGVLRCAAIWPETHSALAPFVQDTRQHTMPLGRGLPGRVWASGEPAWIRDVQLDPNFPRVLSARQTGLHGASAFPIKSHKTVYGVVEFFCREVREPDADMQAMMVEIATLLSQVRLREEAEQHLLQVQKLEAVGRLAAGVAHDFNNLLTVINGYGEILLAQLPVGDRRRVYAESILNAGKRAATLTQQLLAFSRRQIIAPVVLNLNDAITSLQSILQRLMGETITIITMLAPDLQTVRLDPSQVDQILMNLAANARDAMPDGGTLTIQTANVELDAETAGRIPGTQPGRYVILTVSDTGRGGPRHQSPHLRAVLYD